MFDFKKISFQAGIYPDALLDNVGVEDKIGFSVPGEHHFGHDPLGERLANRELGLYYLKCPGFKFEIPTTTPQVVMLFAKVGSSIALNNSIRSGEKPRLEFPGKPVARIMPGAFTEPRYEP